MTEYKSAWIPNYTMLIGKLMTILRRNKNLPNFTYEGIIVNDRLGILVKGVDSKDIREFRRFYDIDSINHYFNKQNRR